MSELKRYWDGLEADSSIDETEIEESLDKVIHRLGRKNRLIRMALCVIAPVVVLIGLFFLRPQESHILQCCAPLGEQRQLILSDGTKVTLNSGSTLVYADRFKKDERKVILNGQAIFEVTKNEHCPFVVSTHAFDVKVLGTIFDVCAYSSSVESSIVLAEGSVSIEYPGGKSLLVPGQMAEFYQDGRFAISGVEAQDYLSWRNGGFILKKAGMPDIVDLLKKQYGVDVKFYYSEKYADVRITAKSHERMSLENFLQMLEELIPGMEYKLSKNNTLELY